MEPIKYGTDLAVAPVTLPVYRQLERMGGLDARTKQCSLKGVTAATNYGVALIKHPVVLHTFSATSWY